MMRVLDDYEGKLITPERVEQSLESHMQALEGIGLSSIHKVRTLTYRLVAAHLSDGELEFKNDEKVADVLAELRDFLRSLSIESKSDSTGSGRNG